jgi:hypothetical protein
MSTEQKEIQVEMDEWEKMACEFLLEEKTSSFNKVCSACGEDLFPDQLLICKECLEIKSLDFFKWATKYIPSK